MIRFVKITFFSEVQWLLSVRKTITSVRFSC